MASDVETRTMLLSVDGTLLVEIDSPERQYASYRTGVDQAPLPVPGDARELVIGTPRGNPSAFFFRPAVIDAVHELANAGVDIVWNTRWLSTPSKLDALARELDIADAVRVPTEIELPVAPTVERIDFGPNRLWEHWKVQALVLRVSRLPQGAELVLVDAHLDYSSRRLADGAARRARRADAAVGGVTPNDTVGLDQRSITVLRAWAAGGPLPRE